MYHYGIFIKGNPNVLQVASEIHPADMMPTLQNHIAKDMNFIITDDVTGSEWLVRGSEVQVALYQPVEERIEDNEHST